MKIYSLFTRNVHTFRRNVHEPGSRGSRLFSCLKEGPTTASLPIVDLELLPSWLVGLQGCSANPETINLC